MKRVALHAAAGLLWGLHVPLRWLSRVTGRGAIALALRAEAGHAADDAEAGRPHGARRCRTEGGMRGG